MTTTTDRPLASSRGAAPAVTAVTQRRVIAAEGIKARGLRSTRWLLLASVLSIVAAGIFPALGVLLADIAPAEAAGGGTDPTGGALTGVSFTQLLIAALGVLLITSEYTTGLIRATFTAVPRRLPVLWAKAIVAAAGTLVGTLGAVLVTFLTAQAVLSAADVSVSLGTPGVLRALVGSALYLAVTAVLAVGFGALLRSAIGALAALFGLLFVLPLLGMLVPQIDPYLPSNAGAAIMQTGSAAGGLSPWAGLGVFTLYAAAALAAAAVALTRRDA
jgi:ABC-type transport system involved in multi-copper enzyme maturation permease subunit